MHTFQPLTRPVNGVGKARTRAEGQGTAQIQTEMDG